ncbi:MAG: alpha/beta family hydrolase [Chryseolinea sp.]
MDPVNKKVNVSESIGEVSTRLTKGSRVDFMMVLAHGAGAGMDHLFMEQLATALAESDIATLRFNFPFAENKKGRPDFPAVAEKTISMAIEYAKTLYPGIPLVAAGKSFGGRMSSQLLSKSNTHLVQALVFYGFPLHPPGNPGTSRADHLAEVKIPMLFLQGTKDSLADLELIKNVCNALTLATLETIEGADHAFKAGKREIVPALASATLRWLKEVCSA